MGITNKNITSPNFEESLGITEGSEFPPSSERALDLFDKEERHQTTALSTLLSNTSGVTEDEKQRSIGNFERSIARAREILITFGTRPQASKDIVNARVAELKEYVKIQIDKGLSYDEALLALVSESEIETNATNAYSLKGTAQFLLAWSEHEARLTSQAEIIGNLIDVDRMQITNFNDYVTSVDAHTDFMRRRHGKNGRRESNLRYFARTGMYEKGGKYYNLGQFLTNIANDTCKEVIFTPIETEGFIRTMGDIWDRVSLDTDISNYSLKSPDVKLSKLLGRTYPIEYFDNVYMVDPLTHINSGKGIPLRPMIDKFYAAKFPTADKFTRDKGRPIDMVDASMSFLVSNLSFNFLSGKDLTVNVTIVPNAPVVWDPSNTYVVVNPAKRGSIVPRASAFTAIPLLFIASGVSVPGLAVVRLAVDQVTNILIGMRVPLVSTMSTKLGIRTLKSKIDSLWSAAEKIVK